MTFNELIDEFDEKFAFREFPSTYEVDHETYANVCQYIFSAKGKVDLLTYSRNDGLYLVQVALGEHYGILVRNIELILKERE